MHVLCFQKVSRCLTKKRSISPLGCCLPGTLSHALPAASDLGLKSQRKSRILGCLAGGEGRGRRGGQTW